ncbi:Phosphatidylserine/phosphatidylglycerophosphate/cardiolipin synthase [Klenkia brasiliensis]|uniref:Phosphatidylserine/phosphatidylglycerophosphate/cardiolipin synthase n=1 Tax=Klenkia brasiliensis TaxID=333142 RepID=A0A1G7MHY3_9ACTN|nr:Phosphatidylserine/phosphatidylglycerophosphate/cardiolipin synthase [Klenkia brasiliensis]
MITGVPETEDDVTAWLLTGAERDNPSSALPAWTEGNLAEALVHGAVYFDRLVDAVRDLGPGDHLFFTDWRGDPDQKLRPDGPTVDELFSDAARRGVCVRGLVWRSHWDALSFSKEQNASLDRELEEDGAVVVRDQRVRRLGSHHQKIVVCRHPDDPARDVAFAGGIDLGHTRRDDAEHRGDPQPQPMSSAYGDTPPWHDVQLQVRGPVVGVLDDAFRERWDDPTSPAVEHPLAWVHDKAEQALGRNRMDPDELPAQPPPPPPCGPHVVQTLRTYPKIWPAYDFAPEGERSIARGYTKALERARRLVYLEDQYLWSSDVADHLAASLREHPGLQLVVVVPRVPDQEGAFSERPQQLGQAQAMTLLQEAAPGRVHVFDLENHEGTPVYVHAKVCVVDDVWAEVGSDNVNRRSWTHDSELSNAVLDPTRDPREPQDPAGLGDGARTFARDLRLQLGREHLDAADDTGLLDPDEFVAACVASAEALDAWHAGGRVGPRPPGRLRVHRRPELTRLERLWATPLYRLVHDPDGRPLRLRLRRTY